LFLFLVSVGFLILIFFKVEFLQWFKT